MRKYLQIICVLGAFFLLVYLKSLPIKNFFREDDEAPATIGTPQQKALITNSPKISPTPILDTSNMPVKSPATFMPMMRGAYKDGTYTGSVEDAFYGNYQVQAVISGGKLTDVIFLQYPSDNGTSLRINTESMPILKSEAIAAQSAQVDIVSGASDSSPAFSRSLANALSQAK